MSDYIVKDPKGVIHWKKGSKTLCLRDIKKDWIEVDSLAIDPTTARVCPICKAKPAPPPPGSYLDMIEQFPDFLQELANQGRVLIWDPKGEQELFPANLEDIERDGLPPGYEIVSYPDNMPPFLKE